MSKWPELKLLIYSFGLLFISILPSQAQTNTQSCDFDPNYKVVIVPIGDLGSALEKMKIRTSDNEKIVSKILIDNDWQFDSLANQAQYQVSM